MSPVTGSAILDPVQENKEAASLISLVSQASVWR